MNTSYSSAFSGSSLGLDHDLKKQRNSVIDRDAYNRQHFWNVAIGRTTTSSKRITALEHQLAVGKGPVKQVSNNIYCSPPSALHGDSLIRIPLSAPLQIYFLQMENAVACTCHPYQIHQEALQVVSNLTCQRSVQDIAKTIFFAGTARIEYTRSIALLVHDIMTELVWRDWDTKKMLEDTLLEIVIGAFNNSWTRYDLYVLSTQTGVGSVIPALEETRDQVLNTAAFLADLFAIGLVPASTIQFGIRLLIDLLSSVVHCRALYLILIHTTSRISTPLGNEFLSTCRADIVYRSKMGWDDMTKRWFIEICNVIDKTLAKDAELPYHRNAPLAWYRWDRNLCCDSLLGMLGGGIPPSAEEVLFTSVAA